MIMDVKAAAQEPERDAIFSRNGIASEHSG